MVIFDTNAILRGILQDNLTMAEEVKRKLSSGETCFIPVEVVAEIVFVLSKVYALKRDVIAKTLTDIADVKNVYIAQKPVVIHALHVYAATTFDFVDCLLVGYAKVNGHSIFTFDKKLQKYLVVSQK